MRSIFGMMPSSEIVITKDYLDEADGLRVSITAGKNGWTVIYADGSTEYKDVCATAEENFNEAYKVMSSHFPNNVPLNEHKVYWEVRN